MRGTIATNSERFENSFVTFLTPFGGGADFHVGEIVGEVVGGDVPESEVFDAGGVDDLSADGEDVALGGGSGVAAFFGVVADNADLDIQVGLDSGDEGAFSHAAVAGE